MANTEPDVNEAAKTPDVRVFRGLLLMLLSVGGGVLAFLALPSAVAHYVVPGCFLVAFCSLGVFYRDYLKSLRQ